VLCDLGRWEIARLDYERTETHLREALDAQGDVSVHARAAIWLSRCAMVSGSPELAVTALEAIRRQLDRADGELALELEAAAVTVTRLELSLRHLVPERLDEFVRRAAGSSRFEPIASVHAAGERMARGAPAAEVAEAITGALRTGPPQDPYAFSIAVDTLIRIERYEVAAPLIDMALEMARAQGLGSQLAAMHTERAKLALGRGALADAHLDIQLALELVPDRHPLLPAIVAVAMEVALERGELEAAEEIARRHPERLERERLFVDRYLVSRGRVRIASGEVHGGLADLLRCGELLDAHGTPNLSAWRPHAAPVLAELGEDQRGDRPCGGGRDPAVRLRYRHRDGPPHRHRDPGTRERAGADQRARPAHRRADSGADARDDDRAGRRHRLRAVHRHPPQAAAARRHGDGGVDRACDRHSGSRRRVRGHDRRDRARVAAVRGHPLVTKLGYTAAIAVVVAVLGATTLLPALLGALGARIHSLRVKLGRTHPDDHRPHGWAKWACGVARRPWISLVTAATVLVVLALPVLNLHLGQSDVGALPESTTARQAYDAIGKGFGEGTNGPLLVAAELGKPAEPNQKNLDKIDKQQKQLKQQQQQIEQTALMQGATQQQAEAQAKQQTQSQSDKLTKQRKKAESPATDPRLTDLSDAIAKTPDVKSVSPPALDKRGTAAVYTVVSDSAPSSDATEALVNELRSTTIPKATKGTDVTASVGGQTAGYIDLASRISDKLPAMIAIVVGLSFVVLMLAFRSLVVPAKAALMNLLSVAAAYGVVTFVFQEGHGASLIGLDGPIPIVSFVPLLMFAILFGLSMDYEVFLLTQIQEHYRESRRPTRAVIEGLANTGRVITSAALIMVCVFTSFVLNGDPVVKQFGVGLAVAIAIDATLVRCLLVPAVMTLLGRASWWMPTWLGRRLPRLSIEGEDYFAKRRTGGAELTARHSCSRTPSSRSIRPSCSGGSSPPLRKGLSHRERGRPRPQCRPRSSRP
jgi:tetratricopeptide (TPR) repeat protein